MTLDAGPHATPDQIRAAEKRAAAASANRDAPPVADEAPEVAEPVVKARKQTVRNK